MLDTRPRQLLLIDNDTRSLEAIGARAEAQGWTIHPHTSAATAIRDLRNIAPEVVMTRLELPILSGRQVVLAVRGVDEDLPVVTFSDHAEVETAIALMRAGAFDCLVRPMEQPRNLEAVLERAHFRAANVRDQRRMARELEAAQSKIARHLEQEAVIRQNALERIERPMAEALQQITELKEMQTTDRARSSVDALLRTFMSIRRILDRAEHDSTMSGQHALAMEEFHVQHVVEFARDAMLDRIHAVEKEMAFFVPANIPPHRGDPRG